MTERDPKDDRTVTSPDTSDVRERPTPLPSTTRLGALASFAELGATLLGDIESSMIERWFAAGSPLMRQGESGDCLVVVQEGEVEVSVQVGNDRHVLKRAGKGEVFGEMALLTQEPRTATVMAVTPVRALVLPVADFHRLARNEPALAAVLSRLTARRLGEDTHDALSGKIFHGHTIRQRLGRGGMAVVYEADEAATGRRVALKMMSHRFIFREEAKQRFQREADLIESFDHQNIAKMFGRFEAFHTFFIVMEFCDGASLDQILGGLGRLAFPDARRILGQLASALEYAHGRRVVHRDLKPSNVMVNRDGIVKLMDFGLAQPLHESGPALRRIAGTPPYMAPEQLTGEPLGTATDVFALGGVAWELLTGTTPFRAVDFEGLRKEHQAWALPPLASILPGIDEDLASFVEGCLVRDPERRLADLSEVASWAAPVDYRHLVSST